MRLSKLPGTTISFGEGRSVCEVLETVTLGGGLVLSQVSALTGLEGHMVQNWVKRGFVAPPVGKKYSKTRFCRIALINFLRQTLQIDKIVGLIGCINGKLDDESDDIISDDVLYTYLVDALTALDPAAQDDPAAIDAAVQSAVRTFETDVPDGAKKLAEALKVMVILYTASRRIERAEALMEGVIAL